MDLDVTQIKELYEQNKSLKEIAATLDTYPQKVWRVMKAEGMQTRTIADAQRNRRRHTGKYQFNRAFLDQWTPDMAWFVGLMFADGNIQNTRHRAMLSSRDIDLLEQVRDLLGSNFPIEMHGDGPQLYLYSLDMVEGLEKYGITVNKSLTKKFPDVPADCLSHFMRGYYDGNGYISTRGSTDVTVGVELASLNFAQGIATKLSEVTGTQIVSKERTWHKPCYIKGVLFEQRHPIYAVTICGPRARTVLNWMYQDSTPQTRLARKFEKAKKHLEHS
jgi:hypothetical protein